MTADIRPIPTGGDLRLSPIQYYDHPTEGPIQLGVFGEIVLPNILGLGLIARTELTQAERNRVGRIAAPILENPFAYLAREFDQAWHNASPGHFLEYLCEKHRYSLHIGAARKLDVRKDILLAGQRKLTTPIRSFLIECLDAELLSLLWDDPDTFNKYPKRQLSELKAA